MDEREKLRKFRELDDAFAEALKELESSTSKTAAEPKADVLSLDERRRQQERERQAAFERRLEALMNEYSLPAESVSTLMQTLVKLGKIA